MWELGSVKDIRFFSRGGFVRSGMGLDEFSENVLKTGLEVVEKASSRDVVLRILGALAVYLHCKDHGNVGEALLRMGRVDGKTVFTDLDLIGYSKQRKQILELMRELGFDEDRMINALFGHKRLIFSKGKVKVDIFFDKLEFSHDVEFGKAPGKGRLELDYPTISLTDLVLEKLQIHQINKKDIVDLIAIFLAHPVSNNSVREGVDGSYIARLLADDWGFWYDATNNLMKVLSFAEKFGEEGALTAEQVALVKERVNALNKMIEEAPKSKAWLKRSKKGTSKPWYREVGEL